MGLVPTLAQGAALRQFGMLRTDQLPTVAAQWLAGDADTPTCASSPLRTDRALGWSSNSGLPR